MILALLLLLMPMVAFAQRPAPEQCTAREITHVGYIYRVYCQESEPQIVSEETYLDLSADYTCPDGQIYRYAVQEAAFNTASTYPEPCDVFTLPRGDQNIYLLTLEEDEVRLDRRNAAEDVRTGERLSFTRNPDGSLGVTKQGRQTWLDWLTPNAWAAVAFQAQTSSNSGANLAASLTFGHTVSAGSNLATFMAVTHTCSTSCPTSTTATFNGDSATAHANVTDASGASHENHLFRLAPPDVTAGSVVIAVNVDQRMVGGAVTFTGVDQTTPLGTSDTDAAGATTLSCTVTVPTDGGLMGTFGKNDTTEALVITVGTQQWNQENTNVGTSANRINAGVTKVTTGSQTITGTSSLARQLACIAAPINPAAAAPATEYPKGVPFWFRMR